VLRANNSRCLALRSAPCGAHRHVEEDAPSGEKPDQPDHEVRMRGWMLGFRAAGSLRRADRGAAAL
jgi:hypothetical protein